MTMDPDFYYCGIYWTCHNSHSLLYSWLLHCITVFLNSVLYGWISQLPQLVTIIILHVNVSPTLIPTEAFLFILRGETFNFHSFHSYLPRFYNRPCSLRSHFKYILLQNNVPISHSYIFGILLKIFFLHSDQKKLGQDNLSTCHTCL